MKTKSISNFSALMVAVVLFPTLALGATLKAGEEVTIPKGGDIQDNLYVAGGNVSINSIVSGDLFAAGGNILVSENVTEDALITGGSITLLGDTGGDLRAAGGDIVSAGKVAGDLLLVGGSIAVSSDVSVGKDLIIAGGQVTVDGEVMGDAEITAGVVTINGHIHGDVIVKAGEKLVIGDGAVIDGNLSYSANNAKALHLNEDAVVTGKTTFKQIETVQKAELQNFIVAAVGAMVLFKIVVSIIAALILIWLFRNFSNSVVEGVGQNPLRMLGYGFVVLIVAPAAALLLFVTLLGFPLGLMILLAYGLILLVSGIYAGVVVGAWLSKIIFHADTTVITWKNVVSGVVVLAVVNLIPIVGWIIGTFVFLVTVGSMADILHKKLWTER